jgi:hypothetical protein
MFGVTIRTAFAAAAMPVVASVLGRVLEELIPLFGSSHQNSMLANAFTAVSDHALLIGLLAALITLLAKAVTESQVRA